MKAIKYIIKNTAGKFLSNNGGFSTSLKNVSLFNSKKDAKEFVFMGFETVVKVKVTIEL